MELTLSASGAQDHASAGRAGILTGTGGVLGAGPDHDTVRAVGEALARCLSERVAEARSIQAEFGGMAGDVAELALRGGKRLRGALVWWGWRAVGGPPHGSEAEAALRVACAMELLQACALIHDDVMDGSVLRRGGPSMHERFAGRHATGGLRGDGATYGRSMAVLAGDLALAWADDLLAEAPLEDLTRRRVQVQWRATRAEMVAGQQLDLQAQALGRPSVESAVRIAYLKSALYSVERPLAIGAALATADEEAVRALRAVGRWAGLAFQLRDDVLGVFGDPEETGKPSGEDVREGKITCLVAISLARAVRNDAADRLLRRCLGDPDLTVPDLDAFRTIVTELGGRAAVERRIERLSRMALHHLHRSRFDPLATRRLAALVRCAAGVPDSVSPACRPLDPAGPAVAR